MQIPEAIQVLQGFYTQLFNAANSPFTPAQVAKLGEAIQAVSAPPAAIPDFKPEDVLPGGDNGAGGDRTSGKDNRGSKRRAT